MLGVSRGTANAARAASALREARKAVRRQLGHLAGSGRTASQEHKAFVCRLAVFGLIELFARSTEVDYKVLVWGF